MRAVIFTVRGARIDFAIFLPLILRYNFYVRAYITTSAPPPPPPCDSRAFAESNLVSYTSYWKVYESCEYTFVTAI